MLHVTNSTPLRRTFCTTVYLIMSNTGMQTGPQLTQYVVIFNTDSLVKSQLASHL